MKLYLKRGVIVWFLIALGIIGTLGIYSYWSIQRLIDTAELIVRANRVISNAEKLLVTTINMETGQRGFVITGDERYLAPYDSALKLMSRNILLLEGVTEDFPEQKERVQLLKGLIEREMKVVSRNVEARRQSFELAQQEVQKGEGKRLMDSVRTMINLIQEGESEYFNRQNTVTSSSLVQFQYSFIALLVLPVIIILFLFYSINTHLNKRQESEKNLKSAAGEISHLNKELEAFTYSVSHDLRAPLRSVDGYAQILKEDYGAVLDEEGNRVINVITGNAKRMGQLIDDLLDFSRLGRKEVNRRSIDQFSLAKEISAELNSDGEKQKAEVNILSLEKATGDESMMRQVWINLISNALKYSGKNAAPRIEIGCFSKAGQICYYVKDNGVGFNMEYVHKLFGVFQRLHKQNEFEGTGVGLALVHRIISKHGGSVWAEGKLNEGATFFFSLPK